jgi:hypothetical protein
MKKVEAILALTHGEKIRHSSFSDDEFLLMDDEGDLTDEQGLILPWAEFWQIRTGGMWEDGWEVIPMPEAKWAKSQSDCDHKGSRVIDDCGGRWERRGA